MLSKFEKKLITAIQGDLPITKNPYQEIAKSLNVSEKEVLTTLENFSKQGIIRRLGATLRHQKSGLTANAMVAWQVVEEKVAETGQKFAQKSAVSHCYRRNPVPGWPYNLYTMVHATNKEKCLETTREMASEAGLNTYSVLFSQQELKKTSMRYFDNQSD